MSQALYECAETVEASMDVEAIRADFPVLQQQVYGHPLAYLDNAATTQKPQSVIDAINRYYTRENANVHRGVHYLSELSTANYEAAREKLRRFINARSTKEIVFVRGATEAINLVAQSYGRSHLKAGDEILISALEHHSNIVPWQLLCEQTGTVLKVAPIDDKGQVLFSEFERLLSSRTRLVAMSHMSNALGTINPVGQMIDLAHAEGVPVLLDGAQAAAHLPVDVYNDLPYKFEAGTPNIAGVIGFGAAIDYLTAIGLDPIARHEHELLAYATKRAQEFEGLRIIGTAAHKASILSFVLEGIHPHDLGTILDRQGIAIRAGHHCAMPVMDYFGLPATARASFALYNTMDEVDQMFAALEQARRVFG